MLDALGSPFTIGSRRVFTAANIGIAAAESAGGVDSAQLLADADVALYASRRGQGLRRVLDLDLVAEGIERPGQLAPFNAWDASGPRASSCPAPSPPSMSPASSTRRPARRHRRPACGIDIRPDRVAAATASIGTGEDGPVDESGGFDPRWDLVRWSGPAGVAVLWIGIGEAVRRSGFSLLGDQPLSRMGEDDRVAYLFAGSLVVAAVLFLVFCAFASWAHAAGWPFTGLMVAGMLGQLVAGVVPIGPVGSSDPTHVIAGLVLGGTIPCFVVAYASTRRADRWRAIAWRLAGLQVASTVVGIALSRTGVAALAEILPAVTFHAWVLAVAMHRPVVIHDRPEIARWG